MIFDHILLVITIKEQRVPVWELKLIFDLVSYSGFLFCFGYATEIAYFAEIPNFRKVYLSAFRILVAFYISSVFALLFYTKQYDTADFIQILTFSKWMVFCEFIPSFGLALALNALFYKQLNKILERPFWTIAVSMLLLFTTWIPSEIFFSARWGLLVGVPGELAISFPILPYFPIYILGMYIARHHIRPNLYLVGISFLGIISYYVYRHFYGIPTRFPPTITWILGTIGFVLFWYILSSLVDRFTFAKRIFVPIGANAIYYLVFSNLLIYSLVGSTHLKLGLNASIGLTLAIVAIIFFLTAMVRHIKNIEPIDQSHLNVNNPVNKPGELL